jgi:magnesium-protoporphyrin O-methyltransferase
VTCAAHCCAIDAQFDARVARKDLDNYRRNGPSPSTRQLLSATRQAAIAGMSVLDIGGGIGAIAHELLASGAAHATLVDASAAYLAAARDEAERRRSNDRMKAVNGDFTSMAQEVPVADIVTLDKVVCCYPDMERLLATATGRARRLFAIVYPRDSWWMRLAIALQNAIRALRRSAFRVYVFPSTAIDSAIRRAGLTLQFQQRGFVWIVAVYERSNARQ